jgi:hypothetical protein
MLFYFLFIFLISTLFFADKIKKGSQYSGFFHFIVVIIILTVAIIRFDVGWDYAGYYSSIQNPSHYNNTRYEPLSRLFVNIALYFDSPPLLFVLYGIPTYLLVYLSFRKYSANIGLSMIIYIGLFYLISFSVIRQALAMAICFFSYKYLQRKLFLKYSLCILLATLFHYSAIISLFIYYIYHYNSKLKSVFLLICFTLLSRELLFYIIEKYTIFGGYIDILFVLQGGSLTRIFYILLFISLPLLTKYKNYSEEEKSLLSVIFYGLAIPFILGSAMGERLIGYFILYFCFIIPSLLYSLKFIKTVIYYMIFNVYFLLTIYISSNIPGQKSPYTPYQTIFNNEQRIFKDD